MKKKWLALVLTVAMVLGSLTACGSDTAKESASGGDSADKTAAVEPVADGGGKVLNIYVWNDEFQTRVREYYPGYDQDKDMIGDVKVNWVVNANENNVYQTKLDAALEKQESASADDKIDMFLIEADYAEKYTKTDYTLDVKSLGITDDDMVNQYQYTKDVVTDDNKAQKGISWQGCPGGYIYRRSIAKKVLGTDDPAKVQEAVADWDTFAETAKTAKDKGYYMLSGYDDAYRVFSNNTSAKWVTDDKKIVLDDSIKGWIDQTKKFTDEGYNQKSSLWDKTWTAGMGTKGKVLGYFMPAWGISFSMAEASLDNKKGEQKKGNGSYGDWGLVLGPQSFNWGGTWVTACKGTDNADLVSKIMKTMTCDDSVLEKICLEKQDFVNSKTVNKKLTDEKAESGFLGGQCLVEVLAQAAEKIDMSKLTSYDQGLNEELQSAMKDYFAGTVDYDKALANFYSKAETKYPALSH